MPEDKKEQLKRFVNEVEISKAVHTFLVRYFLRPPKNKDVQSLAAAWMAKDLMDAAWRELQNYKNSSESEQKELKQIGL